MKKLFQGQYTPLTIRHQQGLIPSKHLTILNTSPTRLHQQRKPPTMREPAEQVPHAKIGPIRPISHQPQIFFAEKFA